MLTPGHYREEIHPVLRRTKVLCELVRELTFHALAEGKGERSPMHPHAPFVVNEPPFPKAVHEEAHSRARRADYLRESLLVHFQHHGLRLPSRTGQQQRNPRE